MQALDFSRKNGDSRFNYESRENWKKRMNRVSGLIADNGGHNGDIVDTRDYKDIYTAAFQFQRSYMTMENLD